MAESRYWDANAFLGYLNEELDKVNLCREVLEEAESGKILIATSALTLAEVLWLKGSEKLPVEKSQMIRDFFKNEFISVRNVDRAIAEKAQDIVWSNSIKPKDAIHVATALQYKIPQLDTFDEQLIGLSGQLGSDPILKINKPIAEQGRLDLQ